MMFPTLYHKIPCAEPVEFLCVNDKDPPQRPSILNGSVNRRPLSIYIVSSLLLFSVLLNVLGLAFFVHALPSRSLCERSPFAKLERNITRPWTYGGLYDSPNETTMNHAWDDINIDAGTVALEDAYVERMELPKAQRFPWDESKGIYYINGYHNLHCLKEIRSSYVQYQTGTPQTRDLRHIKHCFDALRQDILCNADDTPRYSGFQPSHSTGLMQAHKCRDWKQLEEWAKANTGCWRHLPETGPGFHLIEQYKFCPPGSPYAARVAEVFGSNFST